MDLCGARVGVRMMVGVRARVADRMTLTIKDIWVRSRAGATGRDGVRVRASSRVMLAQW